MSRRSSLFLPPRNHESGETAHTKICLIKLSLISPHVHDKKFVLTKMLQIGRRTHKNVFRSSSSPPFSRWCTLSAVCWGSFKNYVTYKNIFRPSHKNVKGIFSLYKKCCKFLNLQRDVIYERFSLPRQRVESLSKRSDRDDSDERNYVWAFSTTFSNNIALFFHTRSFFWVEERRIANGRKKVSWDGLLVADWLSCNSNASRWKITFRVAKKERKNFFRVNRRMKFISRGEACYY